MGDKVCPECGCEIADEPFEKDGVLYCCEPCAAGCECTCGCMEEPAAEECR